MSRRRGQRERGIWQRRCKSASAAEAACGLGQEGKSTLVRESEGRGGGVADGAGAGQLGRGAVSLVPSRPFRVVQRQTLSRPASNVESSS
eukprot:486577-Rhodomonas_salina.1